jgi:ligand-binding sensor domain-containing protein/two-component sensor histidine kinase
MRFFIFFLLLFGVFLTSNIRAQEPVYRHYTTLNGLSSSETYDVLEDDQSFIWIATDYGLVRFDGFNFTIYDKQNGLPENAVFNLKKDDSGNIWFNTFNGLLAYWDGKKIHPYVHNQKLSDYLRSLGLITTVFVSYDFMPDSCIYFDVFGHGLHRITKNGIISKAKKASDSTIFDLKIENNKEVLFNSAIFFKNPILRIIDGDKQYYLKDVFKDPDDKNSTQFRATHYIGNVYFSFNNFLLIIREGVLEKRIKFNNRIISLFHDNDRLWVGTVNDGVFMFDDLSFNSKPHNYLVGNSISHIFVDHEGGVWLTSLNNGVFYYPSTSILKFDKENGLPTNRILDLDVDKKGNIWLGLDRGFVASINTLSELNTYKTNKTSESIITCIRWDEYRKSLIVGTNKELYLVKNGIFSKHPFALGFSSDKFQRENLLICNNISRDPKKNHWWLGRYTGLTALNADGNVVFASGVNDTFNERVEALETDSSGVLWMGTLHGLWQYSNGEYTHYGKIYPVLDERITEIKAMGDTLLLGTHGNGLIFLTKEGIQQMKTSEGLTGNSINCLVIGTDHVYAGTNKGISVIDRKNILRTSKIEHVNISTGLSSNEVTSMRLMNDKIYVGTTGGLNILSKKSLEHPKNHFPVIITHLTINDQTTELKDKLEIEFEKNSIEIDYFAISYRNKGKITYRHRMIGLHNDWIENQRTTAQYPYLPPGNYTFEVVSRNLNGDWNPEPARFSFTVLKPFWQKWWFITLSAIIIAGIIFLIFWTRIRFLRRKNQLLQDIYRYQQEALIGQMNPHFLFNALNTVQRYILENDKIASSRYLSKFAGLMRKTLENSQEKEVTILNEAEALELYLEVEAARYRNRFDYIVLCEPGFDPETALIPVFIIQPLVENALRHGLMNSDRHGDLRVIFSKKDTQIICRVTDNGVGREEAAKIKKLTKSKDQQSLGIAIIRKRIELLNTQEKKQISLIYTDLKNEDGVADGTEVVVSFPYIQSEPV